MVDEDMELDEEIEVDEVFWIVWQNQKVNYLDNQRMFDILTSATSTMYRRNFSQIQMNVSDYKQVLPVLLREQTCFTCNIFDLH